MGKSDVWGCIIQDAEDYLDCEPRQPIQIHYSRCEKIPFLQFLWGKRWSNELLHIIRGFNPEVIQLYGPRAAVCEGVAQSGKVYVHLCQDELTVRYIEFSVRLAMNQEDKTAWEVLKENGQHLDVSSVPDFVGTLETRVVEPDASVQHEVKVNNDRGRSFKCYIEHGQTAGFSHFMEIARIAQSLWEDYVVTYRVKGPKPGVNVLRPGDSVEIRMPGIFNVVRRDSGLGLDQEKVTE